MKNKITIAIDAMGGENAPDKTIRGLSMFCKLEKDLSKIFFLLYGNEELILKKIHKFSQRAVSNLFISDQKYKFQPHTSCLIGLIIYLKVGMAYINFENKT